jgi:ATP-dependent Clp protease protease subunit
MSPTPDRTTTVEAALERDNFMSPEEAQAWGLIDKIVTNREKEAE